MTGNRVKIVGVHRLSVFLHHIVGNIHDVVDGADSVGCQTSLHPLRGRRNLDILDHTGTIAGTKIRILNGYLHIVIGILTVAGFLHDGRLKFFAESGCRLSGDPDHAVAVHTVGGNLVFKHHVVKPQRLHCTFAYHCVFRENIDPVFRRFRIHLAAGTQLLNGTHHAAGLHSSEFSFFDHDPAWSFLAVMASGNTSSVQHHRNLIPFLHIGSARHDLDGLLSHIDLADNQFVSVRVGSDGQDLTDHDLVKVCIQFFIGLHLRAGQRHGICIFLSRHVKIRHICFYPR